MIPHPSCEAGRQAHGVRLVMNGSPLGGAVTVPRGLRLRRKSVFLLQILFVQFALAFVALQLLHSGELALTQEAGNQVTRDQGGGR